MPFRFSSADARRQLALLALLAAVAACADGPRRHPIAPGSIRASTAAYGGICDETGENISTFSWGGPSPSGCPSAAQYGFANQPTNWKVDLILNQDYFASLGLGPQQVFAIFEIRLGRDGRATHRLVRADLIDPSGDVHTDEFALRLASSAVGMKLLGVRGGCAAGTPTGLACWQGALASEFDGYGTHVEMRYCVDNPSDGTYAGIAGMVSSTCGEQEGHPANWSPTVTGQAYSPSANAISASIVTAYDQEGSPLTYAWRVFNASNTVVGSATGTSASFTGLPAGTYTVETTVEDSQNGFGTWEGTVTVADAPEVTESTVCASDYSVTLIYSGCGSLARDRFVDQRTPWEFSVPAANRLALYGTPSGRPRRVWATYEYHFNASGQRFRSRLINHGGIAQPPAAPDVTIPTFVMRPQPDIAGILFVGYQGWCPSSITSNAACWQYSRSVSVHEEFSYCIDNANADPIGAYFAHANDVCDLMFNSANFALPATDGPALVATTGLVSGGVTASVSNVLSGVTYTWRLHDGNGMLVAVSNGPSATFTGLAPGWYAISAMAVSNSDGSFTISEHGQTVP